MIPLASCSLPTVFALCQLSCITQGERGGRGRGGGGGLCAGWPARPLPLTRQRAGDPGHGRPQTDHHDPGLHAAL